MGTRLSMPKRGKSFAAGAALVLLAAGHADSASASSNMPILCDDVADLSFEVSPSELKVIAASHEVDAKGAKDTAAVEETDALSTSHYLAPRVEAVLRRVFEDTPPISDTPIPDTPIADIDKHPAMNARIPGVSDPELARFKRQMYRTDI